MCTLLSGFHVFETNKFLVNIIFRLSTWRIISNVFVVLDSFPVKQQPTVHKPEVGTSLILRCNPPTSYPEPSIYWGESKPGSLKSKLRPIDTDDRVAVDFEGMYS